MFTLQTLQTFDFINLIIMDDTLEPEKEIDELEDEVDDDAILGSVPKKGKTAKDEDDSVDALAEEEEEVLPEDSFDDVDLW